MLNLSSSFSGMNTVVQQSNTVGPTFIVHLNETNYIHFIGNVVLCKVHFDHNDDSMSANPNNPNELSSYFTLIDGTK